MSLKADRGVTLVEILVALVVWGIAAGAVIGLAASLIREAGRLISASERRTTLREAAEFIRIELADLDPDDGDLAIKRSDRVVYRARRWVGATCDWSSGRGRWRVRVPERSLRGHRWPRSGRDSLEIWIDGYATASTDDGWVRGAVVGLSPDRCSDGRPALGFWVKVAGVLPAEAIHPGSPVVGFETASLLAYRGADGDLWVGRRFVQGARWSRIEPIAGPIAANGLRFAGEGKAPVIRVVMRLAGPDRDSIVTVIPIWGEGAGR